MQRERGGREDEGEREEERERGEGETKGRDEEMERSREVGQEEEEEDILHCHIYLSLLFQHNETSATKMFIKGDSFQMNQQ